MILLYIRKRQIIHEIEKTGVYILVILACLVFFVINSYTIFSESNYAIIFTLALWLFCFGIQAARHDKKFAYLHIKNYHLNFYSEYFLLTFPFIIFSLFTSHWYCFFLLQVLLYLLPFYKHTTKVKTGFRNLSRIIPSSNFEWLSGFRKFYLTITPVYLLALVFSRTKIAPLFFLWFLALTIVSFYNECEPFNILSKENESPVAFLHKKIIAHSQLLAILFLPVLIINTICNPELLILNTLFLISQIALLFFAICYKYALYRPNKISYINNVIVISISFCAALPVLLPVPAVFAYRYYFKAKENLKYYFNDKN